MIKVALDSNIFVSAVVFGGKPRLVLESAVEGKIGLYVSKDILQEVEEVLKRPKFKYPLKMIDVVISEIKNISEIVIPKEKINHIKNDPRDNAILECAFEAKADYIVTGDEHLLHYKKYKSIRILTASQFLEVINRQRSK